MLLFPDLPVEVSPVLIRRIAARVEFDTNGCWIADFSGPRGYAVVNASTVPGRPKIYVHRAMYEFWVGPIPKGALVCHHCDVRRCCNPGHLFLGSNSDNSVDAARKGRMAHGERHRWSKLSVEAVRLIRSSDATQSELARVFGVSQSSISAVVRRESWIHVESEAGGRGMILDRDPPARRLALVHWLVDRWVLVIAVRCIEGQRLRSSLEARARELSGPWRILDIEGRRGSVEAAIAALGAPSPRSAGADLVGVQLSLFSEVE